MRAVTFLSATLPRPGPHVISLPPEGQALSGEFLHGTPHTTKIWMGWRYHHFLIILMGKLQIFLVVLDSSKTLKRPNEHDAKQIQSAEINPVCGFHAMVFPR